jgi:hypothetical protein
MYHCKQQVRNITSELHIQETKLKDLREKACTVSENIEQDIEDVEEQINKIYDYKAKGAQIRSRAEWIEKGEKNNKYFLCLEKQKQTKKAITQIRDDLGNITTNQTEILQTEVAYYKKLYSSQTTNETDIEQYLSNTPVEAMQKLNDNESETCNGLSI